MKPFPYYFLFASSLILFSCTTHRADIDNSLKKYFDENNVDGCFTMLSNSTGKVTVYNMELDTMRFSPASTFKVVNSLIGLETGRIINDSMIIPWNGINTARPECDTAMNMIQAFKMSCVPFYQEVARRIGRDTMQYWLDSLRYGNMNITGPIDSFWLNRKLKISPDEQLGLMKRLYFDQLPFRKTVQQNVREVMLQESTTAYELSYKSGWGYEDNGNAIGWLVGWITENRHVYFFVTFVKANKKDLDMKAVRLNITKGILKQMGFFEGKK